MAYLTVVFLRHAESKWNEDQTRDLPACELSEAGKLQAHGIIGFYDLVIVSPLTRALQTLAFSQLQFKQQMIWECVREKKKILVIS